MDGDARIVDAWMQHPTREFLNLPIFESLRRWSHDALSKSEISLEATVSAMDEGGVRLGMLCAWWGPQGPIISNDELASFIHRYPERCVGIAAVNLYRPLDAVRELRRCVKQLVYRGRRSIAWLWTLHPDDRRYYPLYADGVDLGVPFCLLVGHTDPLCESEPGRPIPYLD